jgi:hypothetical protein
MPLRTGSWGNVHVRPDISIRSKGARAFAPRGEKPLKQLGRVGGTAECGVSFRRPMPYYRYHFEVPLSARDVAHRIRAVTAEPRDFLELDIRDLWGWGWRSPREPFVGYV